LKDGLEVPDEMNNIVDGASGAGYTGEISEAVTLQQASYWDISKQTVYPHGYPIHARCWEMIERLMKQHNLDSRLDTLTMILRQTWDEPKDLSTQRAKAGVPPVWAQDYGVSDQAMEKVSGGYLFWTWTDPVDVKAVKDLLTESSKRASSNKLNLEAAGTIMGAYQDVQISKLPLDIKLLVLDCLKCRDIANLLEGLSWEIPNSYWRSRLPGHMFETENLTPGQPFDWQFFALGIEALLETCPGLRNRQRIYQRIEVIKHRFKNPVDYNPTGLDCLESDTM
jgi:hypothetical protein